MIHRTLLSTLLCGSISSPSLPITWRHKTEYHYPTNTYHPSSVQPSTCTPTQYTSRPRSLRAPTPHLSHTRDPSTHITATAPTQFLKSSTHNESQHPYHSSLPRYRSLFNQSSGTQHGKHPVPPRYQSQQAPRVRSDMRLSGEF
jgi:hypothetical protein